MSRLVLLSHSIRLKRVTLTLLLTGSTRLTRKMMLGALREFRSLDSKGYAGWRVDGVFYESLGDAYKAMFDADVQLRYELFGDVDSREA